MLFLLVLFFLPAFTKAAPSANTTDKKTGITYECGDGTTAGDCTFDDLVAGTKKVVNFGAKFALMFSVVVIAVAGGRYMISPDKQDERGKANAMLLSVAKGIIFILVAWLIVTLILNGLGVNNIVKLG